MFTNPRLRRALLPLVMVALVSAIVPPSGAAASGTLLVGLAPGAAPPVELAAAGTVLAHDPALGLAIVAAHDMPRALGLLRDHPSVFFLEADGEASAAGVQASSARWDSSRWDSSRWDSSRWDSSRWDSSRWDSSRWDSSRWDSSRWDSSRWDSSRWDSSRWDSSRWDSSRWDGSAFEVDPLLEFQWGLAEMNVPEAWVTSTGRMQSTICVLDTGVDHTHPDLAPNMATASDGSRGASFVAGTRDTMDRAGHGTHMAGIAAAAVGNGIGTAGVANMKILPAKVLNDHGIGGLGTLAQAIRWCADEGVQVISMSLSSDQDSAAVRRAVEYAAARDVVMVASAGNADGCDGCPVYPAAYPQVIGVSALDRGSLPAPFADAAAHVDFAAPGVNIAGPVPDAGYVVGNGTSQATALMAGAAAFARDHNPSLSADQVRALLQEAARDLDEPGWDARTGWGIVDVARLLELATPTST